MIARSGSCTVLNTSESRLCKYTTLGDVCKSLNFTTALLMFDTKCTPFLRVRCVNKRGFRTPRRSSPRATHPSGQVRPARQWRARWNSSPTPVASSFLTSFHKPCALRTTFPSSSYDPKPWVSTKNLDLKNPTCVASFPTMGIEQMDSKQPWFIS